MPYGLAFVIVASALEPVFFLRLLPSPLFLQLFYHRGCYVGRTLIGYSCFLCHLSLHLQQFLSHRLIVGHKSLLVQAHPVLAVNLLQHPVGSLGELLAK